MSLVSPETSVAVTKCREFLRFVLFTVKHHFNKLRGEKIPRHPIDPFFNQIINICILVIYLFIFLAFLHRQCFPPVVLLFASENLVYIQITLIDRSFSFASARDPASISWPRQMMTSTNWTP